MSTESVVMMIISITFIALYSKYTNKYSSREMSFIKRVRDEPVTKKACEVAKTSLAILRGHNGPERVLLALGGANYRSVARLKVLIASACVQALGCGKFKYSEFKARLYRNTWIRY